jgi:hypothetical protein
MVAGWGTIEEASPSAKNCFPSPAFNEHVIFQAILAKKKSQCELNP